MLESERTQSVRRRYGVPDAIAVRADENEVLACLSGYEIAVREVAAHPDDLPASGHGGRASLGRLETPHGRVLVREYRKGGLLRHLRGSLFRGAWRPLEELVLHRRLQALGVPIVEAVGCVVLTRKLGWRGFLLTREVPGGVDLEAWLYVPGRETDGSARDVLRRAGQAVRRLHDAGVRHADLHPKNLLAAPDGSVRVLDLDKAVAHDRPLTEGERLANLVRLGRALEKHRLKGLQVGRREALRFLEGYAGSADAATEWLERIRLRLRRGLRMRILWWRLTGEARPWRGTPPGHGGAGDTVPSESVERAGL